MNIDESEFEQSVASMAEDLNTKVFPFVEAVLKQNPSIREHLNPAFPFPRKLRIGVLPTHLVVEYVGPEDPKNESFEIEAALRPDWTVLDFLGIDIGHLPSMRIPMPTNIENIQVFLGEAISLLGDYMYDVVTNPNDLMLNGFPDFTVATEPTYVSNASFLWSDANGALRIRRVDFLELFPIQDGGWPYHTQEGLQHFAQFLLNHRVPKYEVALHRRLNEFIELVGRADASEPEITRFLAERPEILQLAFGAHALHPETLLEWQYDAGKPNLKPDFLPVKMDGYADILEFKLPRLKGAPIVGTDTRSRPSSEIDSALAQIDEYAEWSSQEVHRRWLEETKGIKIHTPHTYLVIGHRDDFTAEERQRLRARRNATIFTYDEFIEMARMQLYRVR
ncbi:Shedu anti-phage system protein SduA domain-containing protein [Myxococcus sp. 1LA]